MSIVRVIDRSCLPTKLSFMWVAVYWLLLDRLKAPEWTYGVLWTLTVVYLVILLIQFSKEKQVKLPGFGENE